jgi:hypothetical protein
MGVGFLHTCTGQCPEHTSGSRTRPCARKCCSQPAGGDKRTNTRNSKSADARQQAYATTHCGADRRAGAGAAFGSIADTTPIYVSSRNGVARGRLRSDQADV